MRQRPPRPLPWGRRVPHAAGGGADLSLLRFAKERSEPETRPLHNRIVNAERFVLRRLNQAPGVELYRSTFALRRICSPMISYILFVLLVTFVAAYSTIGSEKDAYHVRFFMHDLVIEEEFPEEATHILKSFDDVATVEEMWQWVDGPFFEALWPANQTEIYSVNALVGAVRFREYRTRPKSCPAAFVRAFSFADPQLQAAVEDCHGPMYYEANEGAPARRCHPHLPRPPPRPPASGPADTAPRTVNGRTYRWLSADETRAQTAIGKHHRSLPDSGYTVDIPTLDHAGARERLDELQADEFVRARSLPPGQPGRARRVPHAALTTAAPRSRRARPGCWPSTSTCTTPRWASWCSHGFSSPCRPRAA